MTYLLKNLYISDTPFSKLISLISLGYNELASFLTESAAEKTKKSHEKTACVL